MTKATTSGEDKRDEPNEQDSLDGRPAAMMHEQGPVIPADDDMQQLTKGLRENFGITINMGFVDLNNIHARVLSAAALRLMIRKGLVTEEEAGAQCQETLRELLAALLQALEEMRATQAADASKPKLLVPNQRGKLARLHHD